MPLEPLDQQFVMSLFQGEHEHEDYLLVLVGDRFGSGGAVGEGAAGLRSGACRRGDLD